ncbi:glycosyl transferase [Lentzea pudingi]|uniref:Glycosyl transferase n=1 Tax=Lentzea pudingi TaxID=1789439 RepID=A0ABQ2HVD1_9PSEU|nr:glycosyltransferase [Lentzea pudingi]GGM92708.1 glycosyl transferase [Lentzea pudingi]
MKIAVVSLAANPLTALRDPDVAGARLRIAKLSEALHRLGHEVTVYTRRADWRPPDVVRISPGFQVVHVPAGPEEPLSQADVVPHLGAFARFLGSQWGADPPDVVHAHHWTSGLAAVLGTRNTAIPAVQSFHELEGGDHTGVERLVGREATCVVAASEHEMKALMGIGLRRSAIVTVPWGVDVEEFATTGAVAPRTDVPRIVTAGRLAPHDGVDDLIVALTRTHWGELVIAGGPARSELPEDREYQRLRDLATCCGVLDRVTFLGHVPHSKMPALLRSADVVACAQHHAPFGTVSIEAMACGIPVAATDVGSLSDTVVHGVTGLLVPPRQPSSLARALRSLTGNGLRHQEFSFAGQDRARTRYAWDRVALEMALAYQRAGHPMRLTSAR